MRKRAAETADKGARGRALDACHALLLEHGYRRLTVQSVIDRAGIGRATFYSHFRGKEDLFSASVDRMGGALEAGWERARSAGIDEPAGFVRPWFEHIGASRRMLRILAEEAAQPVLQAHMQRVLGGLFRKAARQQISCAERSDEDVLVRYLVGALWSVTTWWAQDPKLSADQIATSFIQLAAPVLGIQSTRRHGNLRDLSDK